MKLSCDEVLWCLCGRVNDLNELVVVEQTHYTQYIVFYTSKKTLL